MPRFVSTTRPSFPRVPLDALLDPPADQRWQVLCGDEGHWRVGVYAPAESRAADIVELERHDCPEFFLLIAGRMTLLMAKEGRIVEQPLELMRPILVDAPHCGVCPDGPHTGTALVVERDAFATEYRKPGEWL